MKFVVLLASALLGSSLLGAECLVEPGSIAIPDARVASSHEPAPNPEFCPAIGTWHVQGTDLIHWSAELVLLEESNDGYFDWVSENGDSGRELLRYEYDPVSGILSLHGYEIVEPRGNIVFATYQTTVTDNGRVMLDGTWWGPPSMSGVWEATR